MTIVFYSFSECCPTVKVSLANEAQRLQSGRAGTYIYKGNINGRNYWVKTNNNEALWYNPKFKAWMTGLLRELGGDMSNGIYASVKDVESRCPTDDTVRWNYHDEKSWKETNDIKFECQGTIFVVK